MAERVKYCSTLVRSDISVSVREAHPPQDRDSGSKGESRTKMPQAIGKPAAPVIVPEPTICRYPLDLGYDRPHLIGVNVKHTRLLLPVHPRDAMFRPPERVQSKIAASTEREPVSPKLQGGKRPFDKAVIQPVNVRFCFFDAVGVVPSKWEDA